MATLERKLEALDQESLWTNASTRTRERFWVCDHYKVLPTDDRFRALTDLQVSALFSGWLYSLPEAELWKAYWSEKSKEKPKVNAKELLDIGYSESEIRAILKELGQ